jgi:hypothetical protein
MISQASAQIIFVRQGGTGNGTSWNDATGNLSLALQQASAGTQIWVAAGTYTPTASADRKISFNIPNGVKVYGGFSGIEQSIEERQIENNTTILSGEIGQPGIGDNSFSVVIMENVDANTILDGLTITAGNANSEAQDLNRNRCGGGLYIKGENGGAFPTISNCTIAGNMGRDGAGVYNNGRNGESSPTFVNCVFKNNEAGLDGGAMYNDGRMNGKSNPSLTNCTFERNMGTYGGAICNATETGTCNLTIENCTFKENAAYLRGGAVFSMNGDQKCYMEMTDCNFVNNYPDDQSMVFTSTKGRQDAYDISRSNP